MGEIISSLAVLARLVEIHEQLGAWVLTKWVSECGIVFWKLCISDDPEAMEPQPWVMAHVVGGNLIDQMISRPATALGLPDGETETVLLYQEPASEPIRAIPQPYEGAYAELESTSDLLALPQVL